MGKSLTPIALILLLLQLCLISTLVFPNSAQATDRGELSARFLDRLPETEAHALVESMRKQIAIENCMLHFDFLYTAKGVEESKRTQGLMLIAKLNSALYKRIYLQVDGGSVEYIIRDGVDVTIWKRDTQSPIFKQVDKAQWFDPLIDGVTFRLVDLIMPYLQWHNYHYQGPRVMGVRSIVDAFIFIPEDQLIYNEHGINSIRVSIDRHYKSIRKVEYLGMPSQLSILSVLGVKKINGLWTLSRLSLQTSQEKTVFKVNQLKTLSDLETHLYLDPRNKNIPSVAEFLMAL